MESAASGLYAALSAAADIKGLRFRPLPPETATGALARYISSASPDSFQPMNINFGIISPLGERVRGKKEKNVRLAERALRIIDEYVPWLMDEEGENSEDSD